MPRRGRRRGRLVLAAVLAALLAGGLGLSAASRYTAEHSPGSVARGYFQALAAGDAPAALAFAADAPHGPFLTGVVLRRQLQVAALSDIAVLRTLDYGSAASVDVRYQLRFAGGARTVTDRAELVRRGSSWRLSRVASTVSISAGSARVSFAGRPLPAGSVTLFPGALPLAADSQGLRMNDQPLLRLADLHLLADAGVALTASARQQIERAIDRSLAGCLAAGSSDPLCPLPDVTGRPIPGSLRGTAGSKLADSRPRIDLQRADAGLISIEADVPVRGSWQIWDFENQVVARHGPTTVVVRAEVALDRPTAVFWQRPS